MPYDLADQNRDEDGFTLWTSDASRALERGDYSGAIAILIESGSTPEAAERFVAASLAINSPLPVPARLARLVVLVDVARASMAQVGWSFADVNAALELAQSLVPTPGQP